MEDSPSAAHAPASAPDNAPCGALAGDGMPKPPRNEGSRAAAIALRIAYAAVFLLNVQCAIQFVLWPQSYAPQFELAGIAGVAAVRGLGVAFLMWNATYPAVIANPHRFRALAVVVLVQQAIGLAGESWIWASLPAGHDALAASIGRFAIFDAAGLVLMAASLAWLAWAERQRRSRRRRR